MSPFWQSIFRRVAVSLTLSCVLVRCVECFSPLWDSVTTQVYQEYEITQPWGQNALVRAKVDKIRNSELIVGQNINPNSRIILVCKSYYPAEWLYSGEGLEPSFKSNTTVENLGSEGEAMNGAKRYIATAVVGAQGVKQTDTGRYNCMTASPETGMKFKTLSAFYHLFVPGKGLFIRKRGGTILYDLNKSPARIPCGVTNPKVAVSLQKFQSGSLVNVDNDTMLYHPISGFYPRQDIPGTYVCTAAYQKGFELLHFTLVPKVIASQVDIRQSSEEDLEWLFNSLKLGHSNRIRLSTKRPTQFTFGGDKKQNSKEKLPQIWKRPENGDEKQSSLADGARPGSTYRPVYVLFAEDLNKIHSTTERPSGSGSASGSVSGSGSASEETEEETEAEGEGEGAEGEGTEGEAEESFEESKAKEPEPDHQFHFDPAVNYNPHGPPILLQQLLSTKRPTRPVPTPAPTSLRPPLRQQFDTTYLPFIDFLNPGAAVVKYKPVLNPAAPLISKYETHAQTRFTTTATPKPYTGQIVYDLHSNKLLFDITRSTTQKVTSKRPTIFRIPSLPTQRWPTTRKAKPTTRTTTTTTTPQPPLIPDAVVCTNSPCGANTRCFAQTVYYSKQKETRREPACKCLANYYGNPYLGCHPPAEEESDYLSFNNTDIFDRKLGLAAESSMEKGHLLNTEIFHSEEPMIVDVKKK